MRATAFHLGCRTGLSAVVTPYCFLGLFLVELITVDIIPVDLIIVGLAPVDINDVEAILVQVILRRL